MPEQSPNSADLIAKRNMILLGDRYPEISGNLLAYRKEARCSGKPSECIVLPSANGEPTCKTGNHWIHDSIGPISQAASTHRTMNVPDSSAVLIYRAGLGYLAMELTRLLTHPARQVRILAHEDRWDVIWEALTRLDWSGLITRPMVYLCLGENADEQIAAFLNTHPSLLVNGLQIIPGSNMDKDGSLRFRELSSQLGKVVAQGKKRLPEIIWTIQTGSKSRAQNERIALYGRVFEDQLRGFKTGLERNGAQVNIIDRTRPQSEFASSEISWIETCGFCPDIVASFNRSGFEPVELEAMGRSGIRRISWFYDNPQRFDLTPWKLANTDLFLVFDPHHAPPLKSLTDKRVECLRTATSFVEEPQVPRPPRCDAPPRVSFVGSSGMRRMQGFEIAMQKVFSPLRAQLEQLIGRWRGRDPVKLHSELTSLPISCPELSPGSLLGLIEEYASMHLRLEFLRVLEPLGLAIFGDPGWGSDRVPGTIPSAYMGWAPDYWTETPWIYHNSLINLNIFHVQCMNSPTIRIYDILACGGFLLTEYRPCLEEEFAVGEELETFKTPEELRDKIEYYLSHESQRCDIAKKGQIKVLNNYTYVNRSHDFLQRARSLLI